MRLFATGVALLMALVMTGCVDTNNYYEKKDAGRQIVRDVLGSSCVLIVSMGTELMG